MLTVDPARSEADCDCATTFYRALSEWDIEQSRLAGVARELILELFFADAGDPMGKYRAPGAGLFIARLDGTPVGCVAFDRHDPATAMLHRLYVTPAARGHGAGRALVAAALREAKAQGNTRMLLVTARFMQSAIALYTSLGFTPCAPALPSHPAVAHLDVWLEREM